MIWGQFIVLWMDFSGIMEDKDFNYCMYCGEKVSAGVTRCEHCGEWLGDNSVSRNHIPNNYVSQERLNNNNNNMELEKPIKKEVIDTKSLKNTKNDSSDNKKNIEYSNAIPIRRLFLLLFLTMGLYGFYWFYKNSCYLRDDLGHDNSPGLRTILLLIPILNIFVFYDLLSKINNNIEKEGIESYSPSLNTLIMIFLGPISIFSFWVFINVQEVINELWRFKQPNLPIRRTFSGSERIVLFFGILLWVIYIFIIFPMLMVISGSV